MDHIIAMAGEAADIVIDLATGRVPVEAAQRRARLWVNAAAEAANMPYPFPEEAAHRTIVDLMADLDRSVHEAKAARDRHVTNQPPAEDHGCG
jgi:hypothetical protein